MHNSAVHTVYLYIYIYIYIYIYLGGRTSNHHTTQKKQATTSLDTFRNSVFSFLMNIAPGRWDHARLVLWDAQSQNQEKLGWGLP